MRLVRQRFDDIIATLSPLEAEWMDDTAAAIMERVRSVPDKPAFDRSDVARLMAATSGGSFQVSKFCAGLFLGLSKDALEVELKNRLGASGTGTGIKSYQKDRESYLDALEALGLPDAMMRLVNSKPVWSDLLEERLRSGRGSAIQGQRRGRALEDFAEEVIQEVFEDAYVPRCTFQGVTDSTAKCDFAIPGRTEPLILVEAKGYGATGSKMSDIIGDLDAIIGVKRSDASLLLVTDGLTWKARANDMRKIVERQNDGRIARIYTKRMRDRFHADLLILKEDYGL